MRDHSFNGVPVRRMPRADILECLAHGVKLNNDDGDTGPDPVGAVMLRLQIELTIRALLGELH